MNPNVVSAAEHRLQLSIDRLMALDTRAGVFLGLILAVGGTLAALTRPVGGSNAHSTLPVTHPWGSVVGLLLILVAALLAAVSLIIAKQLDNPRVDALPYLMRPGHSQEYLDSVARAVNLNNRNARFKSTWLQFSLLALFLGIVCILFVGGAVT